MKICKNILRIFYVLWGIAAILLLVFHISIAQYDAFWRAQETGYLLLSTLIAGALSLWLYFRPRCKRKRLRVTKHVFATIIFLIALITAIAGSVYAYEAKTDIEYHIQERQIEKKLAQDIIDKFESNDTTEVDWAIARVYSEHASLDGEIYSSDLKNDIEEAYERAYIKRAQQGNALAELIYGEYYDDEARDYEDNRSINREHAFYWWSRSASHGYGFAYVRMAECYEGIINIPTLTTNRQIAFEWWHKAGLAGYSSGYYNMGRILAEDDRIDEAFECWHKADSMGNRYAREALTKVYSNGVQEGAIKKNPL